MIGVSYKDGEVRMDVDCVGDICPVPVVKAKLNFKKINVGESITIITDHSCSAQSLKDAFKGIKCSINVQEEDGIWFITIEKK